MESASDLKIYGQGSSGGGKFRDVIIKGSGQINGDLECKKYEVFGSGEMKGDLTAETVMVKGQFKFAGQINAVDLQVFGQSTFNGDIFADEASFQGNLESTGDLNAEICKIEGGFKIDGLLNVELFELTMHWPCKVSEIGGTNIKIKNETKFSFLGLKNMITPHSNKGFLEVDTIEGDEIYLENTHAKVVRGKNITLGPDCQIDKVEYQDSYMDHEKSRVESAEKI
ncbi:MAG: polymer-forming cytoskeletal protein [Methanobacterium sp.]|nr:polymer-forming cytoskeletal protein [Methanobacterium sp.]